MISKYYGYTDNYCDCVAIGSTVPRYGKDCDKCDGTGIVDNDKGDK